MCATTAQAPARAWDYAAAASAVQAEPGVEAESPPLEALHILDFASGRLVSVVEIVSPSNKAHDLEINQYRQRRARLLIGQGVNVVEIDATRSYKRLLDHPLAADFAYHTAVYLPRQRPRLLGVAFGGALPRLALPLREEATPLELGALYDGCYRQSGVAAFIDFEGGYDADDLPFPTTLTPDQRAQAQAAIAAWRAQLAQLQAETG